MKHISLNKKRSLEELNAEPKNEEARLNRYTRRMARQKRQKLYGLTSQIISAIVLIVIIFAIILYNTNKPSKISAKSISLSSKISNQVEKKNLDTKDQAEEKASQESNTINKEEAKVEALEKKIEITFNCNLCKTLTSVQYQCSQELYCIPCSVKKHCRIFNTTMVDGKKQTLAYTVNSKKVYACDSCGQGIQEGYFWPLSKKMYCFSCSPKIIQNKLDEEAASFVDWEKAQAVNTIEGYEEFLKKHADNQLAGAAKIKIEQEHRKIEKERKKIEQEQIQTSWKKAQDSDTIEGYEEFLKKHQRSQFASTAKSKIQQKLKKKEEELAQARKDEEEQIAKGLIKRGDKWVFPENKDEAQEFECQHRARKLVFSKYKPYTPYKTLNVNENRALCVLGKSFFSDSNFDDEMFIFMAKEKKIVEEETYRDDLYWAGSYTFTGAKGVEQVINFYSSEIDLAIYAVRMKFSLFDKKNPTFQRKTEFDDIIGDIFQENPRGFGSGFIITKDGYILSNYHVVKKAKSVKIRNKVEVLEATIIETDAKNDLALLKINGSYTPITFGNETTARLGQTVFTVGFPMPDIQGFSPKVTKGIISSLSGIKDDERNYQIDAAVQPGNSGGPLADDKGRVIGIVSSVLNPSIMLMETGNIAQNVNYAIKTNIVLKFLSKIKDIQDKIKIENDTQNIPFEDAVDRVQKATVLIIVN